MLIVAGSFAVEPEQRDAFLAGRLDAMRATRDEPGCLEYVMSADPIDPSRVVLFERWADQAAFDGHMVAVQSAPRSSGPAPLSFSVSIYDISGERAFG
jgi:quinol monooxygenase YgiN